MRGLLGGVALLGAVAVAAAGCGGSPAPVATGTPPPIATAPVPSSASVPPTPVAPPTAPAPVSPAPGPPTASATGDPLTSKPVPTIVLPTQGTTDADVIAGLQTYIAESNKSYQTGDPAPLDSVTDAICPCRTQPVKVLASFRVKKEKTTFVSKATQLVVTVNSGRAAEVTGLLSNAAYEIVGPNGGIVGRGAAARQDVRIYLAHLNERWVVQLVQPLAAR